MRAAVFGAAVVVARLLGQATFGEFGLVQSTLGLFGALAGAGLGLTTTTLVARVRDGDPALAGRYITASLGVAITGGTVMSAALFVGAPVLARDALAGVEIVGPLRAAAVLVFTGTVIGVQSGAIAGLENFRGSAGVAVARAAGFGAVIIGSQVAGLLGAVGGLAIADTVTLLAGHVVLLRSCSARGMKPAWLHRSWAEARAIAAMAVPVLLSAAVTQAAFWLSSVLLATQPGGYAALGSFVAADKWRQLLLFVPAALSVVSLPVLSSLHGADSQDAYRRVVHASALANLAVVAVPLAFLVGFGPAAMGVFGRDFESASATVAVLGGSAAAVVVNTALGQVLVSSGLLWRRFAYDAVLAATVVSVVVVTVGPYRELGLAIANLAGYSVVAVLLAVDTSRRLPRADRLEVAAAPTVVSQ